MNNQIPDFTGLRIGYDHPDIVLAPYCVICLDNQVCLEEEKVCINPALAAVLLCRECRGLLIKTFKPGVWRCKMCGKIINQKREI